MPKYERVENLDGMWPDGLREYAAERDAAYAESKDFGDFALATYAVVKARAMEVRQLGNVSLALTLERACDTIYSSLPKELRW